MTTQRNFNDAVVIIGGGFSGLSIAAVLAKEGIPVTLLEAAQLGMHASTVNQGWLYSGAWFAPQQTVLAKMCHDAFRKTVRFCPDCLEPGHTGMLFAMLENSDVHRWTDSWERAGIPANSVARSKLKQAIPDVSDGIKNVFLLPDRSMRPQVLLRHLADVAATNGARVHTGIRVTGLNAADGHVTSVTTGCGETIPASLVIIATGASESEFSQYLVSREACRQSLYTRVTLQTHLLATPQLSTQPFCVPDACGLNHLPHLNRGDRKVSVFGVDRWHAVSSLETQTDSEAEFAVIRENIRDFFPRADLSNDEIHGGSGTTVQAMHVDQVEPGHVPLPTVIDHAQECPAVDNLLSVYPGRATLWSQLAEDTAAIVLQRLKPAQSQTSQPPWA
jgi:glycine/D-amino acid oxidase-like deaminating enzyme